MKPVITIPSYRRPDSKIFSKLKDIPLDKYVFVRQDEVDAYRQTAGSCGFKVITLKKVTDIGNTREAIVKYLSAKGIEWAFMFDDDISRIECLAQQGTRITSARVLFEPGQKPRFETKALNIWFKTARKYNLSLSSPNHRAYERFQHGILQINCAPCSQCVLLHIPDILKVGNYRSLRETGNEDFYIQYRLMSEKFLTGKVGSIEYDCPKVGAKKGGNSAEEYTNIVDNYRTYTDTFLNRVCSDENLVRVKTYPSGQPAIKFVWKGWGGERISLPGFGDLIGKDY